MKAWEDKIFGPLKNTKNIDFDKPIREADLSDPENPIVVFILYIYSLETFLYRILNEASRKKIDQCIPTLGPYCLILGTILK
jgi:hypothetical protein